MERRFCDSSWPHSGESSGGDYVSLQHTMLEKDREISSLEIQVEEQVDYQNKPSQISDFYRIFINEFPRFWQRLIR